jgi:D-aspartate ligase
MQSTRLRVSGASVRDEHFAIANVAIVAAVATWLGAVKRPAVEFDSSVPALLLKIGRYPLYHGALGAIRSLGRVGVPVYAITEDRLTPAAVSRYLGKRFIWPTTGSESAERLLDGLATLMQRVGRPTIVIPTDDEATTLVAENASEIPHLIAPPIRPDLPRMLASKRGLYELCQQVGVPTPRASFPSSVDDVQAFAESGSFPIVVKNVDPWVRLEVHAVGSSTLVRTAAELATLALDWPEPPHVMLQEYLPGEFAEDWIFHGYCGVDSLCRPAFTGVKLRSWPPKGGITTYGRTAPNPELRDRSTRLLRRLGYRGIVDLDWRFDRRDGLYKLLDFNPRVGAQFRLFETEDGVDVVRALHLDLTGRPIPTGLQIEGRSFAVENLYAASLISRQRPAAAPPSARKTAGTELAWFSLDDPVPFLVMAARFAGPAIARLAGLGRQPRAVIHDLRPVRVARRERR